MREQAERLHCETVQVFTSNPRSWSNAKLNDADVTRFRRDMKEAGIYPLFAHAPYLPNLAAGGPLLERSIAAVAEELERCAALGCQFLVTHVGKAADADEDTALKRVADNVNQVLDRVRNQVVLLLENTAGMGSELGYRFKQVARVIERVDDRDRVGTMLDTAHSFEAGYDWRTKDGADSALREFDSTIGLSRLYGLHLNDSKTALGSRVDRHWHIGRGMIGWAGMTVLVNHPLLRHLPAVMETPKHTASDDAVNMRAVRKLVQ